MKFSYFTLLIFLTACTSKTEVLTLVDLKAGEKAEIIAIEIPEGSETDMNLNQRLFKGMGIVVGVKGTSRGPKEATRGINYGFDLQDGSYFGLYEPQASMVRVKRIIE